jgi:hypothetical protein
LSHLTVTCRCTRPMRQEPGRRAGYLMCSCGNRVRLDDNRAPVCVGRQPDNQPCPNRLVITAPVPICRDHRAELLRDDRFTGGLFTVQQVRDIKKEADSSILDVKSEQLRKLRLQQHDEDERAKILHAQSVVYYLALRDHIKIGVTTNMKARMMALMPDAVLATEPGDRRLEKRRHMQFKHLRGTIGAEYFSVHPELLTHIELVLAEQGPPMITGYPTYDRWHLGEHMLVPAKTAAHLAGVPIRTMYEWIREERLTVTRPKGKRGALINALEAQELAGLRKGGRLPRLDKAS